jgi:hypothetical protein
VIAKAVQSGADKIGAGKVTAPVTGAVSNSGAA